MPSEVVDLFTGEHMKPEFAKINPNCMVPVLEDGDFRGFGIARRQHRVTAGAGGKHAVGEPRQKILQRTRGDRNHDHQYELNQDP